jgi:ubiquinol-cytochrome c reductase cytochrome b subunit
MHGWGSTALLVLLLVRLVRWYLDGLHRPPRELLWACGCLLLLLAIHGDLTGRVLRWDQPTYWSASRGLELIERLPVVGTTLAFLAGGFGIGDLSLIRFYLAHILILPGLFLVVLYLQLSGIRRLGLSSTADETHRSGRAAYLAHLVNLASLMLLLIGLLVTLAVLAPTPFAPAADPLATPARVLPPWYLLPLYGWFEIARVWIPELVKGLLLLAAVGAGILLSFWAGGPSSSRRRWVVVGALLLLLSALGLIGLRSA